MRDGVQLEHDVLLFAFITDDIYRMADDRFIEYPKPRLVVKNGKIVNQNFPVPEPHFLDTYLPRYKSLILELNLVGILNRIRERLDWNVPNLDRSLKPLEHEKLVELALSILDNTHSLSQDNNRLVVFVHLPTENELNGSPNEDKLRKLLQSRAESSGWLYLDLVKEMRKLDSEHIKELFIQKDIEGFLYSKGHFTEKGNQYVADKIVELWPLINTRG